MSINLATVNYPLPSIGLTAQSAGVPRVVYVGQNLTDGWVKVWNEAPFQLLAASGNGSPLHEVSAQAIDTFSLPPGVKMFTLTPLGVIPQSAPSYTIRMAVFPYGPPPGSYPQALVRQSSPTTASVKFGYTQNSNGIAGAAGDFAFFVGFNPLTSGKDYVFYSALGLLGASATLTIDIFAGPQINAGSSVGAAQPHDPNSPVSQSIWTQGAIVFPGNAVLSQVFQLNNLPANVITQCLNNGALCVVHPGENFAFLSNIAAGSSFQPDVEWYEQ